MIVEHFTAYKHDGIIPQNVSLGPSRTFISRRVPRWLRVATRLIMTARESRDYLYLPDVRCIEDLELSHLSKINRETRRYGHASKLKKCVRNKSDWFFTGFFDKLSFLTTQSQERENHSLVEYQSCYDVLRLGVYSKKSIQNISGGSAFTEDSDFDVFIPEIGGRMFKLGISTVDNEEFYNLTDKPISLGYGPEVYKCGYHIQIFFSSGNAANVSDSDSSDSYTPPSKLGLGHPKSTLIEKSAPVDTESVYGKGHDIFEKMKSEAGPSEKTEAHSESEATTDTEPDSPEASEADSDGEASLSGSESVCSKNNEDVCWLYNSYSHLFNSNFSEVQSLQLFTSTFKEFEVRRYTRREIESPFRLYDFVQSNIINNVFPKLSANVKPKTNKSKNK
jgi:hypothetical protein